MPIDKEVLDIFISEAKELIERALDILQKGSLTKDDVNELFRVFHTIKGNSSMVGLSDLAEVCHKIEDVLHRIREGGVTLSKDLIDKLIVAIHNLNEIVDLLAEGKSYDLSKLKSIVNDIYQLISIGSQTETTTKKGSETQQTLPLDVIASISEKTSQQELSLQFKISEEDKKKIAEIFAKGLHLYKVHLRFSVDPVMMMFRYFQTLQRLSEFGEVVKMIPDEIEKVKTNEIVALVAVKKLEDLEEALKELPDLASYSYERIRPDDFGVTQSDIEEARKRIETIESRDIDALIKKVEELVEEERKPSEAEHRMDEIRVDVKSLDELFNLVGELVLIKSRLYAISQQIENAQLKEVLTTFSRLVSDLQDQVMRLRLVPLQQFFKILPGYVKDIASKFGKDVDIYFEGGEIALDRKVLEKIVEPIKKLLEIIVRDSIEVPDIRIKKGKPGTGAIKIVAVREGGHVVIIIEEDGQGIDPDEVKFRAIELGLVSASAADKMSKEEVLMLVTLPGFSFKDGRFSGLDSVRRAIESLGGSFEIHSNIDVETRYVIRIPVSMATMRALLVKVNNSIYAIPASNIQTIVNVTNIDRVAAKNVLKLHDKLIPMYSLSQLLGLDMGNHEDNKRYAIIIEKRNKQVAVLVDEVLGQEDIVVKSLGKTIRNIRGIAGATILGDGRVCLILDLVSLIP